jgi:hypothetical protein
MSSTGAAVVGVNFDLDDEIFPVEVPASLDFKFNAPELILLSGKDGKSLLGGGGMAMADGGIV